MSSRDQDRHILLFASPVRRTTGRNLPRASGRRQSPCGHANVLAAGSLRERARLNRHTRLLIATCLQSGKKPSKAGQPVRVDSAVTHAAAAQLYRPRPVPLCLVFVDIRSWSAVPRRANPITFPASLLGPAESALRRRIRTMTAKVTAAIAPAQQKIGGENFVSRDRIGIRGAITGASGCACRCRISSHCRSLE